MTDDNLCIFILVLFFIAAISAIIWIAIDKD